MGSWNNTFQTLIWAYQFYLKALVVKRFAWRSTSKPHSLRPCDQIMQKAHCRDTYNWIPTWFSRQSRRFNGFLHNVSNSFQNLWKALQTFLLTRGSQFVIETINSLAFGLVSYNSGSRVWLVISNRPRASRSSDLIITRGITPWIVLHTVQLLLLSVSSSHLNAYRNTVHLWPC